MRGNQESQMTIQMSEVSHQVHSPAGLNKTTEMIREEFLPSQMMTLSQSLLSSCMVKMNKVKALFRK